MTFPTALWVRDAVDWPTPNDVAAMTPQHRARLAAHHLEAAGREDNCADVFTAAHTRRLARPAASRSDAREAARHTDDAATTIMAARERANWHRLVAHRLTQGEAP